MGSYQTGTIHQKPWPVENARCSRIQQPCCPLFGSFSIRKDLTDLNLFSGGKQIFRETTKSPSLFFYFVLGLPIQNVHRQIEGWKPPNYLKIMSGERYYRNFLSHLTMVERVFMGFSFEIVPKLLQIEYNVANSYNLPTVYTPKQLDFHNSFNSFKQFN